MSDGDLRRLERGAGDGDAEQRARLLRARLRSGGVRAEHARLAAALGDRAAGQALGGVEPVPQGSTTQVREVLEPCGVDAGVRATAAIARWLLGVWDMSRPFDGGPRAQVEAVEAWALCPCAEHAEFATRLPLKRLERREEAGLQCAATVAWLAARGIEGGGAGGESPTWVAAFNAGKAARLTMRALVTYPMGARAAVWTPAEAWTMVWEAWDRALIPWLLGDPDPLVGRAPERLEARPESWS